MYLSRVKIVYSTGRIAFACGLFFLALLSPSCGTVRSFRGENLYKTLFSGICLVLLVAGGLLAGV